MARVELPPTQVIRVMGHGPRATTNSPAPPNRWHNKGDRLREVGLFIYPAQDCQAHIHLGMSMGIQHAYDRNHWSSVVWAFAFGPFAMYHTRHGISLMGRTRESWSVPFLARRLAGEFRRHSNHFVSFPSCDYDSVLQAVGLRDLYDNARRSWPSTVTNQSCSRIATAT